MALQEDLVKWINEHGNDIVNPDDEAEEWEWNPTEYELGQIQVLDELNEWLLKREKTNEQT